MMARVRGVMAVEIFSKSGRKVPGVKGPAPQRLPAGCWARSCRNRAQDDDLVTQVHIARDSGDGLGGARYDGHFCISVVLAAVKRHSARS
jgi:hypothetical protein